MLLFIPSLATQRIGFDVLDWNALFYVTGTNFSTTNLTATDVTGLNFPSAASSLYEVEAILKVQSSNAAGARYTIAVNDAGATGEVNLLLTNAQVTSTLGAYSNSIGNFPAADGPTTATTDAIMVLRAVVTTGVNGGNITVQTKKTTAGTITVYIGSVMKIRRLA